MSTDLYERDFYTWTQRQAEALRRAAEARVNTPDAIDWINLIDEVESMGSEQADKLGSAYRVTLLHLLKWRYQPDHRSSSWRGSVVEHRAAGTAAHREESWPQNASVGAVHRSLR